MKTKHVEKFIAAGVLAVFTMTAAGCVGAYETPSAAVPVTKSASEQVKTLCDSATAKANAGDTAGAKRDIDFAIANAARIELHSPDASPIGIQWALQFKDKAKPEQQKDSDTVVSAIKAMFVGNIDTAKKNLDSICFQKGKFLNVEDGALDAYILIGDYQKADYIIHCLESLNSSMLYVYAGQFKSLMGDNGRVRSICARTEILIRSQNDITAHINGLLDLAKIQIIMGDFQGADHSIDSAVSARKVISGEKWELNILDASINKLRNSAYNFTADPTLVWSNPNNPRRVALAQISKARCALAVAQAKAGDMGSAKNTLYFINDEQDKIATERAIASAGENFLKGGNVAKGIDTLVVIPPASRATAEQIRQNTKTWIDIKNNKLEGILAKMSEKDKNALLDKLELAILDCTTESNAAKNMAVISAQANRENAVAYSSLSDNYLNLQNVLKAVYKTVKEN